MTYFRRIIPVLLLVGICIVYTQPFFKPGFFETDDGNWAVIRLAEMQREIKDGQIPPRWSDFLNHGFGYPLFNFTYPFPFYLGLIPRVFHFTLVDSIKLIFISSVFVSAMFMYLLGREIGGELGGFLSAVFYTVAPFRLVDLYVRGSIGESISMALYPMLFYFSFKFIVKPSSFNFVTTAGTLAMLILSHNISSFVFFPFWIAFLYVIVFTYYENIYKYTLRYFLPLLALSLGLCAYFFIPAIAEKKFIILSQVKLANIEDHFVKLGDYLFSPWSAGRPSFQLGWAHILASVIGLVGFILSSQLIHKKYFYFTIYFVGSIFILVFFAHPFSIRLWQYPPLSWFDFPWRLLTPMAFFLALSTVFLGVHKITRIIGLVLIIVTVGLSFRFIQPEKSVNFDDNFYITNDATTTSMDELMPIWVVTKPTNRYQDKVEIESGRANISQLNYNSHQINFRLNAQSDVTVKINTNYFPGWELFSGDKSVIIDYTRTDGLIRFALPKGQYTINGKFLNTPVRLISNSITIVSVFLACFLLLFPMFKKIYK